MSFLRLSTNCAVIDDEGKLLLSLRGDFGVWNLPGGRMDSGELLPTAAAREVQEETGIIAHTERAVGLYYRSGWSRLTVVYSGFPVGGEVVRRTDETRDNRFFPVDALPELFGAEIVRDALDTDRVHPALRITEMAPGEMRRIRWALRRRYVVNLLQGRPEPRFVRFRVSASAVVKDAETRRVLTLPGTRIRSLPQIVCNGQDAPWRQLETAVCACLDGVERLSFVWVGVWQDISTDSIDFVFSTEVEEGVPCRGAEWSAVPNIALDHREADYVRRVSEDRGGSVWLLTPDDAGPGDVIQPDE